MSPMVHCLSFCKAAPAILQAKIQFVEVCFRQGNVSVEARNGRARLLPVDQLSQLQVLAMNEFAQRNLHVP